MTDELLTDEEKKDRYRVGGWRLKTDQLWWAIRGEIIAATSSYVSYRCKGAGEGGNGSYYVDVNNATNTIQLLIKTQHEKGIRQALQTLVDEYWRNQEEDFDKGFICCMTPEHVIPQYWKDARQALKGEQ